ncbi:hypothetical protein DVH24_041313 [Malus domestica]|uniref:Purple acid phosphatase Fn3-like domain-containing protein n=1 Tax=Malus domestica TaxID=3750 RepID=A0A498I9P5_MALDO|nr:hypothetical protein DVH24_041313 [Malus domestica]
MEPCLYTFFPLTHQTILLSLSPTSLSKSNDSVLIQWSDIDSPSRLNWLGIYSPLSSHHDNFIDYKFLSSAPHGNLGRAPFPSLWSISDSTTPSGFSAGTSPRSTPTTSTRTITPSPAPPTCSPPQMTSLASNRVVFRIRSTSLTWTKMTRCGKKRATGETRVEEREVDNVINEK